MWWDEKVLVIEGYHLKRVLSLPRQRCRLSVDSKVTGIASERRNPKRTRGPTSWSGWKATYVLIVILLDFADYLIYYTRKEVTYELLTHEYNYWR